jgi:CubicO group peptidase (beta-lactamase class C family)
MLVEHGNERSGGSDGASFGQDAPGALTALGTNCNEAARGTTDHPLPSTLGNGLVYDARYLLFGRPRLDPEDPIPVDAWVAGMRQDGFRPVQIDTKPYWDWRQTPTMKWHLPEFTLATIADEDSNHPIRMEVDLDIWAHAELENEGEVDDDVADKAISGLVPFFISTGTAITSAGAIELTETRFNVLYVQRPPSARPQRLDTHLEVGLLDWQLSLANDHMRADGAHLVSLASYRDPSDLNTKLYAGIWHRYTGWVEAVEGDIATEGEEFEPLEDQIRALMAAENIPAAQLAIMKGNDLVLSRAYTRAPVAYAPITTATPLMAGSITKPVTATAAVQAFGADPEDLDNDLFDLLPEPNMGSMPDPEDPITVRDALQHTTGWVFEANALDVKIEIGANRMANSQDWLDYMAQLTGPNQGYDDEEHGNFNYSNFGYEMLALALKESAEIDPEDFEEYESVLMKGAIFDEVGMCRTAYKRQGLLETDVTWMSEPFAEPAYGSCTGGSRCPTEPRFYLTEPAHPYAGATPPLTQLDNPAAFEPSALNDPPDDPSGAISVTVPAYVRRQTYGGQDAIHAYIGAGSLVSTAEDLARFMVSFRPFLVDTQGATNTVLLDSLQLHEMFPRAYPFGTYEPRPFNCSVAGRVGISVDTLESCYGLGWYVGNRPNQDSSEVWSHGGDVDGAVTMLLYHPETDATVAILLARHPFDAAFLSNGLLDPELDDIASGP